MVGVSPLTLCSRRGDDATLLMYNGNMFPVIVSWVDYNGHPQKFVELQAGEGSSCSSKYSALHEDDDVH